MITSLGLSFLLFIQAFALVPPQCAKQYPPETLQEAIKTAHESQHLRSDRLREVWRHFIAKHGGDKSGMTGSQLLPIFKQYNISAFDLTWQQVLWEELTQVSYFTTAEVVPFLQYILDTRLQFNAKLVLIGDWLSQSTHIPLVDNVQKVDELFHFLNTTKPWIEIFHNPIDKDYLARIRKRVTWRACLKTAEK